MGLIWKEPTDPGAIADQLAQAIQRLQEGLDTINAAKATAIRGKQLDVASRLEVLARATAKLTQEARLVEGSLRNGCPV